jgi:hypothetical protein
VDTRGHPWTPVDTRGHPGQHSVRHQALDAEVRAGTAFLYELNDFHGRRGSHGKTPLQRLPYFDLVKDSLLDYMHINKNNGHRARKMMGDPDTNREGTEYAILNFSPTPNMTVVRITCTCTHYPAICIVLALSRPLMRITMFT